MCFVFVVVVVVVAVADIDIAAAAVVVVDIDIVDFAAAAVGVAPQNSIQQVHCNSLKSPFQVVLRISIQGWIQFGQLCQLWNRLHQDRHQVLMFL